MNLYILVNNPNSTRDRLFDQNDTTFSRSPNLVYWGELRKVMARAGITAHTFDFWSPAVAKPDDILLVTNHPGETFLWRTMYFLKYFKERGGFVLARRKFFYENYKHFSKRILFQVEPWVSQPYVYHDLEKIRASHMYTKIFLTSDYGDNYGYLEFFEYWNRDITSSLFNVPKTKFLGIINGNITPHALRNKIQGKWYRELYGERLKAIRYFSSVPGFDLYGWRWYKIPRHPFYFHYGKYVRKAWRGSPEDKTKAMAPYKFAICFENCEAPRWISEKIHDCHSAGCIPVYLGAPDISKYVPPDCFIDFRKFSSGAARQTVGDGSVFDKKSYERLHKFLAEMPEARIVEYRKAIRAFLASRTKNGKNPDDFVKEILA